LRSCQPSLSQPSVSPLVARCRPARVRPVSASEMPPKGKEPEPEPEPEEETPPEPESGRGAFNFPDGSKYEGDWISSKDGKQMRHGHGRFADAAEEQIYEGEWADDAMHGRGSFRYASGAKFEGEFEGNKYHGHGTYTFPDGSSYTGPFVSNQMHGNGCFTDTQGVEWKGRFYNGSGPGLPGHASVLAR